MLTAGLSAKMNMTIASAYSAGAASYCENSAYEMSVALILDAITMASILIICLICLSLAQILLAVSIVLTALLLVTLALMVRLSILQFDILKRRSAHSL